MDLNKLETDSLKKLSDVNPSRITSSQFQHGLLSLTWGTQNEIALIVPRLNQMNHTSHLILVPVSDQRNNEEMPMGTSTDL